MDRSLPGTIHVQGREFLYIESPRGEGFAQMLARVLSQSPDVRLPKSGGVVEEKARIVLSDNTPFVGVSYKGDLDGWRAKIVRFCEANGRRWGTVRGGRFVTSDTKETSLADCEIEFEG